MLIAKIRSKSENFFGSIGAFFTELVAPLFLRTEAERNEDGNW